MLPSKNPLEQDFLKNLSSPPIAKMSKKGDKGFAFVSPHEGLKAREVEPLINIDKRGVHIRYHTTEIHFQNKLKAFRSCNK